MIAARSLPISVVICIVMCLIMCLIMRLVMCLVMRFVMCFRIVFSYDQPGFFFYLCQPDLRTLCEIRNFEKIFFFQNFFFDSKFRKNSFFDQNFMLQSTLHAKITAKHKIRIYENDFDRDFHNCS